MAVVEQLVAAPEVSYLYMARRQSLRLVKVPKYPQFGASGQKVGESKGVTLAFVDGVLRVPKDGKIRIEDGREQDAGEVAEWLDSHPLHGDIQEGFWKVDPVAPPVSQDEMQRLMDAALDFDEDRLGLILEQERSGWGREQILTVAEDALRKVVEMKALAAAQDEQEKKGK
jgi:hypothetical protein